MKNKIQNKISTLIEAYEFSLLEECYSNSFGDYYKIYSKDKIRIRIVCDKSLFSIDISRENDFKIQWFDMLLIKAYIYKDTDLTKTLNYEEYYIFIENNLEYICDLYSEKNYFKTIQELIVLEKERAKQMFPPDFFG
ncbi:MAG TPA: hypothetical protein PK495_07105 [Bacteroidales bacterium]|nr:hypothetical protein [Bacteroidales bacterium]